VTAQLYNRVAAPRYTYEQRGTKNSVTLFVSPGRVKTGDLIVNEIRVVRAGNLSSQTAQTSGMTRKTAIDGASVGARTLWVGRVTIEPSTSSGAHHHGDCESAIFVISGRATFRFGNALQHTVEAGPGDYLYIAPNVIHQELNLSNSEPIDCIVIRDSQENLVINVDLPGAGTSPDAG
jgi:uncharacterized RmlC-like cupin family protein